MADSYNANELVGKTLYANKKMNVYYSWKYPTDANIRFTVKPGDMVGVVYSWLTVGNEVWWQIEAPATAVHPYDNQAFIKQIPGAFDQNFLQEQGAETTAQKTAEQKAAEEAAKEDAKSFSSKMFDFLTTNIKTVAIIGGVAAIGVALISSSRKSK